jgi:hypothetical protein
LDYDQCRCPSTTQRVPKKKISYRPLIPLIVDLINTVGFVKCIQHCCPRRNESEMNDVQHGQCFNSNLEEMRLNYNRQCRDDIEVEPINILVSLFYDGVQVYKRRHSEFAPLLISIMNLPPSFRGKLGIGTFLLSLVTVKSGSAVERFILKCLVDELIILQEGLRLTLVDGSNCFLQVRLVQYILDTVGANKLFKIKGNNSLEGCPICGSLHGITVGELNKCVYIGHRQGLPDSSYLRIFGQTQRCCPEGLLKPSYYQGQGSDPVYCSEQAGVNHSILSLQYSETNKQHSALQAVTIDRKWKCCGDKLHQKSTLDFLRNEDSNFSWAHDRVIIDNRVFEEYLYYPTTDFRPQTTNAIITPENYRNILNLLRSDAVSCVNGIKGVVQFFRLSYFDLGRQLVTDPAHTIKNICLYKIKQMKGETSVQIIVRTITLISSSFIIS